jgi:hypothetical protein
MFRPNQHRALILDAKRQRGSPANKPVLPMRLIAGIIKLVLSASIFSLTFSGKIIILSPSQNKKTMPVSAWVENLPPSHTMHCSYK